MIEALARQNRIPLGQRVRVDFSSGPSLEGLLCLQAETLFLPANPDAHLYLRIGTKTFHKDEIVAFVSLGG